MLIQLLQATLIQYSLEMVANLQNAKCFKATQLTVIAAVRQHCAYQAAEQAELQGVEHVAVC